MEAKDIKKGKKVWYYPHFGDVPIEAEITSDEVVEIGGTLCTFIDIRSGVVGIDWLAERE